MNQSKVNIPFRLLFLLKICLLIPSFSSVSVSCKHANMLKSLFLLAKQSLLYQQLLHPSIQLTFISLQHLMPFIIFLILKFLASFVGCLILYSLSSSLFTFSQKFLCLLLIFNLTLVRASFLLNYSLINYFIPLVV